MQNPAQTSIREPLSIARLSRTFSRSLSAIDLAEPLASLDANQPVAMARNLMQTRHASVLGVRREGLVAGWVGEADLGGATIGECARDFHSAEMLDESAGLDAVLGAFSRADHVFIEWRGEVSAVITRRDLQRPPLRMWLFGAITVLDMNLTWAINQLYPDDTWRERISPGRFEKAVALRAERQRRGGDCQLVDCLQIKDKADILVRERTLVGVLGFTSKREADRLVRDVESLRNHLAHAQELESTHLETATRLASLIGPILRAEGARQLVAMREAPPDAPETNPLSP